MAGGGTRDWGLQDLVPWSSCRVAGRQAGLATGQSALAPPYLFVVMRLPLTKVVEVETERKPIPGSVPGLKDEEKKSEKQGDNLTAGAPSLGQALGSPARSQGVLGRV